MAKYCVKMLEKIFYEIHVEADSTEEAENAANALFENGCNDYITDLYVSDIDVEEVE